MNEWSERVKLLRIAGGRKGPAVVALCLYRNKWGHFIFEIVEISKLWSGLDLLNLARGVGGGGGGC